MDRGFRRYTERRAFIRRLNIYIDHSGWRRLVDPDYFHHYRWPGHHRLHRAARDSGWWMNEPSWWVHEMMTVPARRREQALAKAVVAGADPDGINWPTNKKPHQYYW